MEEDDKMKTIKKIFGISMISSVIFLVLGLLLVFKTEGTIHLISSIIGVILLINGGFSTIKYFKEDNNTVNIIYGTVTILAGFILIVNPTTIVSVLPFVLGIYFTISGVFKLKYALDIKKFQKKMPLFMIIISFLMIICGILFIINPFSGAIAITQVIGIFLIIYSVLDIINCLTLRKDMDIIIKNRW